MKFTLKYEGRALDNHSIGLSDLTNALIGVNQILVESNKILNGNENKIEIEVRALKSGSFICEFYTQVASFYQKLNSEEIIKAKDLLIFLFGTGGITVCGLFELIKKSAGEKPISTIKNKGDNNVIMNFKNCGDITVPISVNSLYTNKLVRKGCDALTSPLDNPQGIDRLIVNADENNPCVIHKRERRYYKPLTILKTPKEPQVYQTQVKIINLSFKERKQWIVSDGANEFSASIEDSFFLEKIENNREQFSKGSILTINLRKEQFEDDEGNLTVKHFNKKF